MRYLGDKPLIQYPIDLALGTGLFEPNEIFINASEEEFAKIADKFGVNFHKRLPEYSSNTATNREFTYDFLKSHECDYVIMVNTTSPLLRENTMLNFMRFVSENDFNAVFSIASERAESFYEGKPLNFDTANKINSQLLNPIDKIVWALTAWKREAFIHNFEQKFEPVFGRGENISIFEIPKDESCDLDTPEDWNIAEGIIEARKACFPERFMDTDQL